MGDPPPYSEVDNSSSAMSSSSAMGDHCTNNPPLDTTAQSTGELVTLDGVEVYISKPADLAPAKLLIFLTNGVGIKSLNNQLQADKFAAEGYLVAMPDLFEGDSAPTSATINAETETLPLLEKLQYYTAEGVKAFMIDMWLARHTVEKTMPVLERALRTIKETYAEQARNGTYAVGYCFGGKYVLKLAATNEIKAGSLAHGTLVTLEDIKAVKQPISMACVENDGFFPNEIREAGVKYLEENNILHEMKVYTNVPHGFAVLGLYKEEAIRTAQVWAYDQMLGWIASH